MTNVTPSDLKPRKKLVTWNTNLSQVDQKMINQWRYNNRITAYHVRVNPVGSIVLEGEREETSVERENRFWSLIMQEFKEHTYTTGVQRRESSVEPAND